VNVACASPAGDCDPNRCFKPENHSPVDIECRAEILGLSFDDSGGCSFEPVSGEAGADRVVGSSLRGLSLLFERDREGRDGIGTNPAPAHELKHGAGTNCKCVACLSWSFSEPSEHTAHADTTSLRAPLFDAPAARRFPLEHPFHLFLEGFLETLSPIVAVDQLITKKCRWTYDGPSAWHHYRRCCRIIGNQGISSSGVCGKTASWGNTASYVCSQHMCRRCFCIVFELGSWRIPRAGFRFKGPQSGPTVRPGHWE
jgi:hypothetical protein